MKGYNLTAYEYHVEMAEYLRDACLYELLAALQEWRALRIQPWVHDTSKLQGEALAAAKNYMIAKSVYESLQALHVEEPA